MIYPEPNNQIKLFGLDRYILDLVRLYNSNLYPNKILLSGPKGIGKSTLAYHFINYVLSYNNKHRYDLKNFTINPDSPTFKTILNKSNPNFISIDINNDKKVIDINQIRDLIVNLNKSSFNDKPRFVLIDNIEFLNVNSINALLKVLEEPSDKVYFILINNSKKILPTLISRCINYKINLTNLECLKIADQLFNGQLKLLINSDFIDYYMTPGNIFYLIKFAEEKKYDILKNDLKDFLKFIIKNNLYKNNLFIKYLIFYLVEIYLRKLTSSYSIKINDQYSYFLKRISDTNKFNLDEEILFSEFEELVLNE